VVGRDSHGRAGCCNCRTTIVSAVSSGFFNDVYEGAAGDDAAVPWQHAISRRMIGEWFETFDPTGHERAIVVAAGLGDDAAAVAEHGLDVVAFDYAPRAVDWAISRHPDADVDWQVADLFAPPVDWIGAFDLVVEVFTIQSNPPVDQPKAAAAIRSFVSPGGTLVAVALVHDGSGEPPGPPWPLHRSTLDLLADGLTERDRNIEELDNTVSCVLLELARPAD